MSKVFIGDFCAHIPSEKAGTKGQYKKIGAVFRDDRTGGISVKIDTMPLPGFGWIGWCNVFEERGQTPSPSVTSLPEDDIPF